ncbi:MAG: SulP family inorganic anion transporter [Chloroflexi bacterium]|nr:SulP family inorganic anion transporter [Chloroflexota bacterium]
MKWLRWLSPNLASYQRKWLGPDVIAGVTLAAVAIPECMGYAKIAGMPVVTGLYTVLLPLAIFALIGSSRYLVVGADSATAAIMFAGLSALAQPESDAWTQLAGASALITGVLLLVAAVARLGFLANFLSRTVLVGFLSGVGVTLLISEIPDMLGVPPGSRDVIGRAESALTGLPHTHVPTLTIAMAVLAIILVTKRFAPRLPGALLAVLVATAVTWAANLEQSGVSVVGSVPPGLPSVTLPISQLAAGAPLLPTALSMFLVILAQSAATSRSFAHKHDEPLNENRDLAALGVSNILAALSGTFVVNGSPTKTAVVESAGSRSQVAQLATAGVVLLVLLVATSVIAHLPDAALAALVFLIGADLIDLAALRRMYFLTRGAFVVAVATLLAVAFLGVERGIFVAIGLSILDHVRREYRPKDVLLVWSKAGLRPSLARPGMQSAPGVLIYRFERPLFFANADYFAERIRSLVLAAPEPVRFLVLDLVSMDDIDYTGGLVFCDTLRRFGAEGLTVVLTETHSVYDNLERFGIIGSVGPEHVFDSVTDALQALGVAPGEQQLDGRRTAGESNASRSMNG